MKKAVRAIIFLLAVMMMFNLFGCGKSKQYDIKTYLDKPAGTMLIDYFDRTVGTPMEQPYFEMVMYTHSEDKILLERYTQGGTDHERCDRYLVPVEAAQEVLNVIRKSGMDRWNSRSDTVGICGKAYVCKFPDGKGDYIRVTSDRMPEDGSRAFGEVSAAMNAWAKDEYLEK